MDHRLEFLVFSDDWDGLPISCRHLMTPFLKDTPITWVETIGLRSPSLSVYDLKRSISKLAGWFGSTRNLERPLPENLSIRDPFLIPYNHVSQIRKWNTRTLIRSAGIPRSDFSRVLITTWPFLGDLIGKVGESVSVYYRVDDFSQFPGVRSSAIASMERELIERVDIVAATADNLAPKDKKTGCVKLLPHGVDYAHFAGPAKKHRRTGRLSIYPRPILGFFGLISSWLDFSLIQGIAEMNPQWSIVMVGPSQLPERVLPCGTNIHYLGSVPYDLLPEYAADFDVGLIPFKLNELTIAVNPLKLLEYFAMGLPVLSTPLPEVLKYRDYVSVANDPVTASRAIARILETDTPEHGRRRQDIARNQSWQSRADSLRSWIIEVLQHRS